LVALLDRTPTAVNSNFEAEAFRHRLRDGRKRMARSRVFTRRAPTG
jgi:hypothetical protein